jgi:putative SOS response-associated peptidase YedK
VLTNENKLELQLYKWGLVPSWAADTAIGNKMINARAETIFEKPSFRNLIKKHRCLVISDGFYEWKEVNSKKQPYRIQLKSKQLFAFAGLWDKWVDKSTGEILNSFTIITCDANQVISEIHNRMPVILKADSEQLWLQENLSKEKIESLLQPYSSDEMLTYAVSQQVNSPKNDNKTLIEPIEL